MQVNVSVDTRTGDRHSELDVRTVTFSLCSIPVRQYESVKQALQLAASFIVWVVTLLINEGVRVGVVSASEVTAGQSKPSAL